MRAISTVVDVTVFLLFVSAAVATLTAAPDSHPEPVVVDDQAALLASSTANVEYSLRASNRTAHGTVASLLARGAVANATIDGRRLSAGHADYLEEVSDATRQTLGPPDRTQVLVRWEPYRGAPVSGTVTVGADPPPGRDVTVATISVPGPPTPGQGRESPTREGFDGVAGIAARATADALLPGGYATLPSGRVSPASVASFARMRTLAEATGTAIDRPLARGTLSTARERVIAGLAARYERDMRDRFETPANATDALSTGSVRITVRRWES
ncbi:MAG: hypothetical protein BRD23_08560 [Halobacteriales archaeon SW_9_67_25]|nr:MAG: hypothetical protein BRD23_08560 [Halobacteriales archaeon SW_9_67_25]